MLVLEIKTWSEGKNDYLREEKKPSKEWRGKKERKLKMGELWRVGGEDGRQDLSGLCADTWTHTPTYEESGGHCL